MHYIIYRVTNTVNGKIYIGKHQTAEINDTYMGSGKILKAAIKKYGLAAFAKEILHVFDSEIEMNTMEKELVTEDFCVRPDTYNLCVGGKGGFSYINKINPNLRSVGHTREMYERVSNALKGRSPSEKCVNATKRGHAEGKYRYDTFTGKTHSDEAKKKIGAANSKLVGQRNSQYGTMWITNGIENRKIKKEQDVIPEGWYKGRIPPPPNTTIERHAIADI